MLRVTSLLHIISSADFHLTSPYLSKVHIPSPLFFSLIFSPISSSVLLILQGGVCPFHYNHWSCDGMKGGGRDHAKANRCRCKVAFDLINHKSYRPEPDKYVIYRTCIRVLTVHLICRENYDSECAFNGI